MDRLEIIEKSLKIFENTNVDLFHLAQIANFSNEEVEITKLFSESLTSDNKFISSEKINLEWLGHDSKNQCISLCHLGFSLSLGIFPLKF